MEIPTHLQHNPIVGVKNYEKLDAMNADNSDAKALSIGIAQYDQDEISAKVWRHSGLKWSRQSEELPLHRVFDLCSLTLAAIMREPESKCSLTILNEGIINPEKLDLIKSYYYANEKYLKPRIDHLEKLISEFKEKMK